MSYSISFIVLPFAPLAPAPRRILLAIFLVFLAWFTTTDFIRIRPTIELADVAKSSLPPLPVLPLAAPVSVASSVNSTSSLYSSTHSTANSNSFEKTNYCSSLKPSEIVHSAIADSNSITFNPSLNWCESELEFLLDQFHLGFQSNKVLSGFRAFARAVFASPAYPTPSGHECILSWDVPKFGRFGNTLLLASMGFLLASQRGCRLLVPAKPQIDLDVSNIFQNIELSRFAISDPPVPIVRAFDYMATRRRFSSPHISLQQSPIRLHLQAPNSNVAVSTALNVSLYLLDSQALWRWGVMKIRVPMWSDNLAIPVSLSSGLFDSPFLLTALKFVFNQPKYASIPLSVGVHLRGEDFIEFCEDFENKIFAIFFSCFTSNALNIIQAIESVRQPRQPVFVSTNFGPTSAVIDFLRKYYGALYIDDHFALPSAELVSPAFASSMESLRPLISHRLLCTTKYFLGNFFSTFSNAIAFRRSFHSYSYFPAYVYGIQSVTVYMFAWILFVSILFVALPQCYLHGSSTVAACFIGIATLPIFLVKTGIFGCIVTLVFDFANFCNNANISVSTLIAVSIFTCFVSLTVAWRCRTQRGRTVLPI